MIDHPLYVANEADIVTIPLDNMQVSSSSECKCAYLYMYSVY